MRPDRGFRDRHLEIRRIGGHYSINRAGSGESLVLVVPDAKYPGMWRVERDFAGLSDMVNLTWALDAARVRALTILNRQDALVRPARAGSMRSPRVPATPLAADPQNAPSEAPAAKGDTDA